MSKKEILKKLKKSLLVATAAVTGMTSSACDVKEYNDNVGFSPDEIHDTIDTKPETSTVETSYDSSVTTGPNDNLDSTVYTTLEDVDVPDDVVVTTVNESSEDVVTREAVTTRFANATALHGKNVQDGGSGVHRRTEAPKTQESQSKQSTKSTAKVTTAKPVTTKKVTAKTTPKTTVTTAQPTTTVTTTTTELVTEPPVTEPEDYSYLYNKDLIGTNGRTFDTFASMLYDDMMANSEYRNSIFSIDVGYGPTFMGPECCMILQALNSNYVSDEVIGYAFGHYSAEEMSNYNWFFFAFKGVLDYLNADIDYSKYTLDMEIGNFLNEMDQACRDGNYDAFMNERFVNGNVSQNVLNNPGAMGIWWSYDCGKYLNRDEINNMLVSDINYSCDISRGYNYSK